MKAKEKETPPVTGAGGNGTANSTDAYLIENAITETSINYNDYPRLIKQIRAIDIEPIRKKLCRLLAQKLELSEHDVIKDAETVQTQTKVSMLASIKSYNDITASTDIEVKYVIDRLLPEHCILMIAGRRGQKKSIIAMRMAIDIATGQKFLDWNTAKAEVIYIDMENNIRLIKKRLRLMSKNNANIPNLKFILRQNILIDIENEKQRNELKEIVKDKIIIFDTLSKIHKKDENNTSQMTVVMGHLIDIAQASAKAIILLHHKGKNPELGGRGSSVIEDNPDIVIEAIANEQQLNFKCTKHRDGKESDFTKVLEIAFSDTEIKIEDATQKELNIFFECLIKLHKEDSSVFSSQTKLIDILQKHSYSKDKSIEILKDCIDYGLIGRRKGENNSTVYYFK